MTVVVGPVCRIDTLMECVRNRACVSVLLVCVFVTERERGVGKSIWLMSEVLYIVKMHSLNVCV